MAGSEEKIPLVQVIINSHVLNPLRGNTVFGNFILIQ